MSIAPVGGGIFSDIITWVRRIIKSPSPQTISDATLSDYINRFVNYEMPERILLIELKRQYVFETQANVFEYQAPYFGNSSPTFLSNSAPPPFFNNPTPPATLPQTPVPMFQEFRPPIYADGVKMGWFQTNDQFYNIYPELVQNEIPIEGDGTTGPYSVTLGRSPILRGFIDELGNLQPYVFITFVDSAGDQHYIVDSGFLNSSGLGILIETDSTFQNIAGASFTPVGTYPPTGGGAGTMDYVNGILSFTFASTAVPSGASINVQTSPFSSGFPRTCLFFNNIFRLYPVPSRPYRITVDAYITPSVFFYTSNSIPFAYMSEYIARGAARKILSDNGDYEQMQFYEPLFREQENLVLRKTSRQNAIPRTPTIFSAASQQNPYYYTQY
jgi:hypothetical protein